jgi:hypothetical protein
MNKWEYLQLRVWNEGEIRVFPSKKVDLGTIFQTMPGIRFGLEYGGDTIKFPKNTKCHDAYYYLIEFLCSNGWEPFAADGLAVHLKRPVYP